MIFSKKYELLSSLSIKNELEFPNQIINNSKVELNNLIAYNSKLRDIESQERILEQDENYFKQYQTNFNHAYEEKQKKLKN